MLNVAGSFLNINKALLESQNGIKRLFTIFNLAQTKTIARKTIEKHSRKIYESVFTQFIPGHRFEPCFELRSLKLGFIVETQVLIILSQIVLS